VKTRNNIFTIAFQYIWDCDCMFPHFLSQNFSPLSSKCQASLCMFLFRYLSKSYFHCNCWIRVFKQDLIWSISLLRSNWISLFQFYVLFLQTTVHLKFKESSVFVTLRTTDNNEDFLEARGSDWMRKAYVGLIRRRRGATRCKLFRLRMPSLRTANSMGDSRMPSSGMLRHLALVRTYVSEERIACIIRVTRIGELGTTQAVTSNRHTLRRAFLGKVLRFLVTACVVTNSPSLVMRMMEALRSLVT
jgi:hypothetical protein